MHAPLPSNWIAVATITHPLAHGSPLIMAVFGTSRTTGPPIKPHLFHYRECVDHRSRLLPQRGI
ncbi:hypothetical protein C0Z20_28075 [Trinickia symbiotica]|uniref:Uncharacterized protein n=1 Tax=Trinickia symbiotica TaxID=863227 RepID=A0A2N7WQU1_9BURK|nr:hypothetical protein C0Z20_28075 [Trinickia symbiotica]